MNKRTEICSLVAGIVFLVSGMAKAIDSSVFAHTIAQYGFDNLQFLSPLISMVEVVIGLLLVFQVWQRWTALAGAAMVAVFTLVYVYGAMFRGVDDCGCFGTVEILNTSPTLTFARNAALLCLLVAVWRKGENKCNLNRWIVVTALIFMCMVAFMSGYTCKKTGKKHEPNPARTVEYKVLKDFVSTSSDSTYLVFAFTYTCPHCLNSIANLKEYVPSGVVDKVIGLALGDSIAERIFTETFHPNFPIKNCSEELLRLTRNFPTACYIRNDSIVMQLSGELPCAYLFGLAVNKGGK
ncbi:MAG: DoxX family protein [Cytophagaceae bacterium]|jgi:uncharacterized membrane protein YphA (DoxX/SURF4 family)|nr:DoxX family protein [Cytophagaceae bacterium]